MAREYEDPHGKYTTLVQTLWYRSAWAGFIFLLSDLIVTCLCYDTDLLLRQNSDDMSYLYCYLWESCAPMLILFRAPELMLGATE